MKCEWELISKGKITAVASRYIRCAQSEIALTDSTDHSMAILLNGFKFKEGNEVWSTTYDHLVTAAAIEHDGQIRGATNRRVDEFADQSQVPVDHVVGNITTAIGIESGL